MNNIPDFNNASNQAFPTSSTFHATTGLGPVRRVPARSRIESVETSKKTSTNSDTLITLSIQAVLGLTVVSGLIFFGFQMMTK